MDIKVAQISEDEGLAIHHRYPEGEPLLGGVETRLVGRSEVNARATREDDRVELAGKISAAVEFDCDRCLTQVRVPVLQAFDLVYVPPLGTAEEKPLGENDLSVGFYRDETIDLDDLVREQIELALPMSRLCKEDCKGLCPECGANLNETDCRCSESQSDPRWAALKSFKVDN